MPSSLEWRLYFESNAKFLVEIPWEQGSDLMPDEVAAIAQSLKEFQVGESSEGKHLFRSGRAIVVAVVEIVLASVRSGIRCSFAKPGVVSDRVSRAP
ncbi:hypothetical protein [Neosynechococcus sphagnicola]|uniref:hypothetical protein n=1 Tax=Neosynechococcus sphagnicola TaxID=1501145 RepID=UPI0012E051DA|nr:hypothetical protein [Neosynechococcus sphagnicola]